MIFLLAKLTKEIIFVCTFFLFLYIVNDLWNAVYTCPANIMNRTTKSAIYVMELWLWDGCLWVTAEINLQTNSNFFK